MSIFITLPLQILSLAGAIGLMAFCLRKKGQVQLPALLPVSTALILLYVTRITYSVLIVSGNLRYGEKQVFPNQTDPGEMSRSASEKTVVLAIKLVSIYAGEAITMGGFCMTAMFWVQLIYRFWYPNNLQPGKDNLHIRGLLATFLVPVVTTSVRMVLADRLSPITAFHRRFVQPVYLDVFIGIGFYWMLLLFMLFISVHLTYFWWRKNQIIHKYLQRGGVSMFMFRLYLAFSFGVSSFGVVPGFFALLDRMKIDEQWNSKESYLNAISGSWEAVEGFADAMGLVYFIIFLIIPKENRSIILRHIGFSSKESRVKPSTGTTE